MIDCSEERRVAVRRSPLSARSGARIVSVPVFHEGTFRAIVAAARRAGRCLRRGGEYWEPIEAGRRSGVYCRAAYDLAWIQERVDEYEQFFYGRMLGAHCGPDGALRARATLVRGGTGAYRRAGEAGGSRR